MSNERMTYLLAYLDGLTTLTANEFRCNTEIAECIGWIRGELTDVRELETYYTEEDKRYYVKWKQSHDDECTDIREVCMSNIPTEYLQRELMKRGVMPNV